MKNILKFVKYFAFAVVSYVVLYVVYAIAVIASKVDLYFCVLVGIILTTLFWVLCGVVSPKFLPFFKFVKTRIAISFIGFIVLALVIAAFVAIEVKFFKRNPLVTGQKNIYYLYYGLKQIHPFK